MTRRIEPMWLACLGQQTFSIQCGADHLLIDPLLTRSFGTSPGLQFEIYPPREIATARMPPVRAIVLTNEHLDHLHVPTLAELASRPTVYCGAMMPRCALDLLARLGYPVRCVEDGEEIRIGGLRVRLFRGGAESVLCEQRVYNVLVTQRGGGGGVLLQSDALVSSALRAEVAAGALRPPQCVVVTDNSQLGLPGAASPWTSFAGRDPAGLAVLRAIVEPAEALGGTDVVLHAGGYIHPHSKQGPYLWADHRWVAAQLEDVATRARIHGLDPWEAISIGGTPARRRLRWVVPDDRRRAALWTQHRRAWARGAVARRPPAPLLGHFRDTAEETRARDAVAVELGRMAAVLRVSPLLATAESLGGPEAQRRGEALVFRLRLSRSAGCVRWVYDRQRGEFVVRSARGGAEHAPFGLEAYLADFHGLLTGELQMWELATCGLVEHWSLGQRTEGLLMFLFAYFGEQLRPELAGRTFARLVSARPAPVTRGRSRAGAARRR